MFFFQIESKSWRQLQEEREALMNGEIERTRREAEAMWARAQAEDSQRLGAIQRERERQEAEQRTREEMLSRDKEERDRKDKARRESIRRQEELLSGSAAATSSKLGDEDNYGSGGRGIQIYHYKDPGNNSYPKLDI